MTPRTDSDIPWGIVIGAILAGLLRLGRELWEAWRDRNG